MSEPVIDDELAKAIAKLKPEEAAYFLWQVETKLRARKIQLTGVLLGALFFLVGLVFAFVYYGLADGFASWIFLVPVAAFGTCLYGFGRWADKVAKRKPPPEFEIKS